VRALLGGLPVELGFIDGMHLFEFALRDFMNLERLCTPARPSCSTTASRRSPQRQPRPHD
jgi:hypothetical protein